ncbi:sugar ABC transporter substrate-binding protein [Amycolatopsis mongoliensis]|uniref:Sugar ABC transporter substrate-binding protein n=1 Tax=Amycolatopsis mongoliensis TaxID=715475 RepID=A0A9Y2JIV5_9PSEU|nr:sugar ABC transporter substrate-binding protein [Amycolatopsis sp. 4-36]WIX98539.1 sugar ABC transporter substrate-binding protein [Amycolatopsis sp. 4-36]
MALLAAAALLLTACGRTADDPGTASAAVVSDGPATGTVSIWAMGAEAEKLPELLRAFKDQNPEVDVQVTAVPWPSGHDKFQAAIAAGTTPDIGQMGTTWMGEFAEAKAFAPTPGNLGAGSFYPGSVDSTKVGGGTFGVPWYVDTAVLYYRTDLAHQAGFDSAPANWDQLRALAAAMQQKAGARYGISLPPKDFQAFLPFAWSAGAKLATDDGTKWTLDSPQMRDALAYYQKFFTDGLADKHPSTETGAGENDFVKGTVPMFIGGAYEVGEFTKLGGPDFANKYATATVPAKESGTGTSFVGGSDLVVFKQAKNPDAAWKLAKFLAKPEIQAQWYKMTGDLPAVPQAWDDPTLRDDPKLAVFGQQLKSVQSPPASTRWAQVQETASQQTEQLTTGTKDVDAVVRAIQSAATSIGTGR